MSITLYGPRMGSGFRCHWILAELGLTYQAKDVNLSQGEHKTPEYLSLNPAGQVPVLVEDDFVLPESAAIVRYLADKYNPTLLGTTVETRATALRWELFVLLNIQRHFSMLAGKAWGRPASEAETTDANTQLARFLPIVEKWLTDHVWLAGDAITVADITARASFNYAELAEIDLSAYPAIMAWMRHCADRPAFAQAYGK